MRRLHRKYRFYLVGICGKCGALISTYCPHINLRHLGSVSPVAGYFDPDNDWLFLEWEGDLTLDVVQRAYQEIARCYRWHASAPRVRTSNAQVTSSAPDVVRWLVEEFLATVSLAGVKQVAWHLPDAVATRGWIPFTS